MNVEEELFFYQDLKYKDFTKKLIPTVPEDKIIGVRIPVLRKIAKTLQNNNFGWDYFEEIMLHGFIIGYGDYTFSERLNLLNEFVPYIDNWSVCDSVSTTLKFINNNKKDFLEYLKKFMYSNKEYEVRFSVVILMNYYFDDEYIDFCIDYLKHIKSEYYYVSMAVAWALSVAFVKYENKIMPLIENYELKAEVHNMTISKINDSLRVDKRTKKFLNNFKIKTP